MEKKISTKTFVLLFTISIGLICLGIGSSYAVFTASSEITNPIVFTGLSYDSEVIETVSVNVPAEETVSTTLNIANDSGIKLNYVVWYLDEGADIDLGTSSGSTSSSLANGSSTSVTVDIRNNSSEGVAVQLGVMSDDDAIVLGKNMVTVPNNKLVPMLASSDTWYTSSVDKASITKITLVNSYTATGSETESWSAGTDLNGDGTNEGDIMCYLNGTELTIAGNGTGKIYTNYDSSYLFSNFTNVASINNLTMLDTSKTNVMNHMFYGSSSLVTLDLSNFDTDNVTTMRSMFYNCSGLTKLDLSNFKTSNVTTMYFMFYGCNSLTKLDLSNFKTSKVTTMQAMFYNCSGLTELNISNFDTSNVTSMKSMFNGCNSLTELNLSNFDTSNVTTMIYMFNGCGGLTKLDLSNFDTSNVTTIGSMFEECDSLTELDLSSFSTGAVTSMEYVFYKCSSLTTIYVSDSWVNTNVTASTGMFDSCSSLVGGAGTIYNSSYIDISYAKIDGGTSNPGYFTEKSA